MIYIYNRDEEQIDILDIKPKFTREIGKFNTLEFESIKEYEKGYRVVYQYKGKPYEFLIQEQDYLRDDMVSFSYFCKDSFVENEGVPILDKRPQGSYKVALNSVLEDTRWELIAGSDFSETLTFFNSFYQVSVLEAFAEIVDKYNLEFETSFTFTGSKITSRKIHIKKIGKQANSRLEFGKNIVKFERKILPENIVTALYGYGKGEETESGGYGRRISFADVNNGLAYVTNEQARQKYGNGPVGAKKHIFGFFIDEEETDKVKLLESTKKELERVSQPQAEYTIEAVNLHIDCDYADTVPVLDEKINFSGETRIIKAVAEGDDLVFVFGHVVKGFTDSFQKEIKKSAEATEIKIISIMETRLNQIADVYFGEDGYNYDLKIGNEYGLPAGLYSFDAPIDQNPTKVIYFGAGKILIADSKASDGSWNWQTALTGTGLVGSSIIAHSITANELASDIGQSLDLSSNTSINLTVKENIDDYFQNNPIEVKVEKPFYAYADIDSIVTAIDRPDEVNYEPLNTSYYFDEDITSFIDENGLDGWKLSYDVKANAETIEWLTVSTHPVSKYVSTQVSHPTTLSYEHYEHLISFNDVSRAETTTFGVWFYKTPFSVKNFMIKKVKNITNFSTSWTNQKYQGVYIGYDRPTDPNAYEWVKIQGIDGDNGNDGVGLQGEPVIKYGKSDDESTLPIEWFDVPVVVEGGLISWTRTILTYTDGTVTNIDTPLKVPLDGEQGQDGRGIIELQTMYGLSDSKDVEPTEWFAIPPEIKGGDFSWTRIELIFNDGTTEFVKTVTQNADILEVREDGYLYVNGVKTDKKVQGENGYTPYVQDGYWYINGVNTGQKAVGEDGKDASILYRFSNDKTTMSLVDNSHRYVGLYRGTGDVNLASSYVWLDRLDLDVLDERTKTNAADIAVNKTNIASKVSQTTYTADQTKINDQLSTITQDMKSWEAKFESVGGTNLLKGSKYVRGWLPINLETITETYANVVQEWDTIDATKVVTNAPDSVSAKKAYKRFEVPTLEEGRLYTFTIYVNNIRTVDEKITLEGGLVGEAKILAETKTRIVIQGYATSEKYIDVILNSYTSGYFASAIVYKAMLELGNQVNDWTPHPDEIESGSTRITEEGLTVGKSNSDVQTSIMDNGLFIQDTISGEPIAEYTRDGAKTSVLTATDIYSDSIIRRQKNSVDVYVGPSMTGDGSGKDSSNRLDNINRAIDVGLAYAYHLTDYATVNIYIKGTINEIVMITGVSGYGNINIIGESGSRLVGAIFVNSCTAQVNVRDLNISLDAPNAVNACVNYHNSTSGNVLNCTLVGQDTGRGVNVTRSYVAIDNTQFFDLSNGIIATDFGRVLATDCKGRTTFKYGSATKGGWLGAIGTRPSVPELPALLSTDTGVIDDTKMTTYASGTRPSFAPPTFASATKTFYADLATSNSSGHEWLKGEARQGTWNGKVQIGVAKFGAKIKDWLAANGGYQGSVTAVVTAKRNSSSGTTGTVSFKITSPATLTLPAVSRGGSSSATTGTSLTNSITTSSNLVLKTSTTSTSDYAGYTSVSIKISTMKKV